MSTTSSENNSRSEKKITINNNSKQPFTFSTDYHVDLLHNSQKLIEPDVRVGFNKEDSETNASNTKSHRTEKSKHSKYQESENMDDYIDNAGNKLSESGHKNPFIPANTLNAFGQNNQQEK